MADNIVSSTSGSLPNRKIGQIDQYEVSGPVVPLDLSEVWKNTKLPDIRPGDFYKPQVLEYSWESWEPDSIHWISPMELRINASGHFSFTAAALKNMRRTGGIFDTGERFYFMVSAAFFDHKDGTELITSERVVATIDYRHEISNVHYEWQDYNVARAWDNSHYVRPILKYQHGLAPPAPTIPLPPVEFP